MYLLGKDSSKPSRSFKKEDLDVKLDGLRIFITSANSGLGKMDSQRKSQRGGGSIPLVCRNPESAQSARDEIAKESKMMMCMCTLDLSMAPGDSEIRPPIS